MKKTIVSALMIILVSLTTVGLMAQPCTPIDTFTAVGLFPDSLPAFNVGQPYSATLSAALPKDTVLITGIPAFDFCEFQIVRTEPDITQIGLAFECDQPDCIYEVDHSLDLNFGCIVISGTPTEDFDSVQVFVQASVGTFDASNDTCITAQDLSFPLTVYVEQGTPTSSDLLVETIQALSLSPNPSTGLSLLSFDLPVATSIEVSLINTTWQVMLNW